MSTGAACSGTVGRQVSYTGFNMAAGVTDTGSSLSLTYDSEHQRIRQSSTVSGTTTVTDYLNDPASGTMSERVTVGAGAPRFVDYISAGGQIVAQATRTYATTAMWGTAQWGGFNWGGYSSITQWGGFNWGAAPWHGTVTAPTVTTLYFVNDHLGSVAVVTDQAGAVVQRLSYDAWGKQRNPDGTDAACGAITSPSTRGFTNQEQLPGSCLVNLNARLYDSEIGKFLTPDPVVGDVYLLNGFNRYAYVLDDPLSLTDTSGLCFLGICTWFNSGIFRAVLGIGVAIIAWEYLPSILAGWGVVTHFEFFIANAH